METEKINSKVSVLIPVYNVEKYVQRCISSVLNQTMQEGVEVIIVNDCTPDKSMEKILESLRTYEKKVTEGNRMTVRIVTHDTNRGLAAVRNTGINCATGDYIIHVDSDDWIEPNMIEAMYTEAISTGADIVVCDHYTSWAHQEIKVKVRLDVHNKKSYFGDKVEGYNASVWNKLIKRALYEDNEVRWIEGLDCGEDYTVIMPLFYYANKISHISIPLYHYERNNAGSITYDSYNVSDKISKNRIDKVEYARNFLKEHNIWKEYERNWAYLALCVKALLIYSSSRENLEKAKSLFPEADIYMTSFLKNANFQTRLIYKGHMRICRLYLRLKGLAKKILR